MTASIRDSVLLYLAVWAPLVLVFGNMAGHAPAFGDWFHAALIGSAIWWFLCLPAGLWVSERFRSAPMTDEDLGLHVLTSALIALPLITGHVRYEWIG